MTFPNTAAQAELLRAEQLSLQHNAQLAFYAQAKAQQIDFLQADLQTALQTRSPSLLPSNTIRRPGPPIDKPAPLGRISSLKLKLV